MPPSAMIGTSVSRGRPRALGDRGDLRHADAGDDARRADRAGADADLDRVDAASISAARRLARWRRCRRSARRRDSARAASRPCRARPASGRARCRRPARRRSPATSASARSSVSLADADRRADAQPAERVLAGVRILDQLLDVLDGDQPLQPVVVVDHQQLLDLVLVEDLARLVERRADRHRDQVLAASSPRRSAGRRLRLEAQVAVGEDADQPAFLAAVLGDRHAGDAVAASSARALRRCGASGESVIGSTIMPLSERLTRSTSDACSSIDEVLVDDADAALLRHRDGQAALGDGVHRGAEDRDVQADVARQPRADVDLTGQHRASAAARAGRRRTSALR